MKFSYEKVQMKKQVPIKNTIFLFVVDVLLKRNIEIIENSINVNKWAPKNGDWNTSEKKGLTNKSTTTPDKRYITINLPDLSLSLLIK